MKASILKEGLDNIKFEKSKNEIKKFAFRTEEDENTELWHYDDNLLPLINFYKSNIIFCLYKGYIVKRNKIECLC